MHDDEDILKDFFQKSIDIIDKSTIRMKKRNPKLFIKDSDIQEGSRTLILTRHENEIRVYISRISNPIRLDDLENVTLHAIWDITEDNSVQLELDMCKYDNVLYEDMS